MAKKKLKIIAAVNHDTRPVEKGKLYVVISTKDHRSTRARIDKDGATNVGILYLQEVEIVNS